MKTNHIPINEIIALCNEHTDIIQRAINERRDDAKHYPRIWDFNEISDIRGYRGGNQLFAVEKTVATGLMVLDDNGNLIVPAILNGIVYSSYPDEGHGGIAHLFYLKTDRHGKPVDRWSIIWTDAGWLHRNEFENLSPVEITNAIIDDIDAGMNVLTHKPTGWI